MSEPIARRKALTDYRIAVTQCQLCGRVYFPPKSFCDKEGRESRMMRKDYFYSKGSFVSGAVINIPTNRFKHLDAYVSGIVDFAEDGFRVPGRVTDLIPSEGGMKTTELIGREVVPRFRKTYVDGEDGLVYYSSLNFSLIDDYYPYQQHATLTPSPEIEKPGIVGYGVYLPKFRIKNENEVLGVKERTLPFADEDTTSFSVEAGKRALIHAGISSADVKKCFVGSESPPYAVKPAMATVCQALKLGEEYEGGFFSGGTDSQFACKAASDLFIDAVALVGYPVFDGEYVLVIGADNSQAAPGDALDFTVGAGAAAYLFGKHDVIATIDCYVPYTSDTPDFYRRDGEKYPRHGGRFTGEPAYYKHVLTAMEAALKKTGLSPRDISYVATHSPNGTFPYRAALQVGFQKEQIEPGLVVTMIGNLYSGSCLTGLAAVLDIAKPEDRILLTSYGSGAGSESYLLTVTEHIEEKRSRQVTLKDQIYNPHRQYVDYSTYRRWKEIS